MIRWLIRQTWLSIRGGFMSALISALTVSGALALVGALAAALTHVQAIGDQWHAISGALVYMEPGVDDLQVAELGKRLEDHPFVTDATWVSPKDALGAFAAKGDEEAGLVDGVSPEFLESHFRLSLEENFDPTELSTWLTGIEALGFVTTVDTAADELQVLTTWVEQLRVVAWFVGVTFVLVNGWVISNTIRIHISGRRDELEIMELIGASRLAVRLPFIIQGAVIGLIAGLGSSVLLELIAGLISESQFVQLIPETSAVIPTVVHLGLLFVGFAAGALGSLLATVVGLGDERGG